MTNILQNLKRLWFRPLEATPDARPLPDLGSLPAILRRDLNLPPDDGLDVLTRISTSKFQR